MPSGQEMDVKFLFLLLTFLFFSYKFYVNFSLSVEERLVIQLQEHFKDVECPAGISLYRLHRNGVSYRIQLQTRLPHNPGIKNRIVKRCETQITSQFSFHDVSHEGTDSMLVANSSRQEYLNVNLITSRLLQESCDEMVYETTECEVSRTGKTRCGPTDESNTFVDYLLEVVKGPDDINIDEQQTKASEVWSIQTLTRGIFPGTLWCGFGNIADDTFGNLGEHSETDDCCRTHDLCKPIIKAFQTRYSYSNPGFVPISHCACDMAFYNCLQRVNTPTSRLIGKIFFNLVKMKCFDFDLREVCASTFLGLCLKREEKCIAVIKRNKRFPD